MIEKAIFCLTFFFFSVTYCGDSLISICLKFGGDDTEYAKWIEGTDDGGFIVAGYSKSWSVGSAGDDYDVFVGKFFDNFTLEWMINFGGVDKSHNSKDYGVKVSQSRFGGYILSGMTQAYGTGSDNYGNWWDTLIAKLSPDGRLEWTSVLGRWKSDDSGYGFVEMSDGSIYMGGKCAGFNSGFLSKFGSDGSFKWVKAMSDTQTRIVDGIESRDGHLVLLGEDWPYSLLIKINYTKLVEDDTVQVIWARKAYTPGFCTKPNAFLQSSYDGSFHLTGDGGDVYNSDIFHVKFSEDGTFQHASFFTNENTFDHGYSIVETKDGGVIVGGTYLLFSGQHFFSPYSIKGNLMIKFGPIDSQWEWFSMYYTDPFNPNTNAQLEKENGGLTIFKTHDGSGDLDITLTDPNATKCADYRVVYNSSATYEGFSFDVVTSIDASYSISFNPETLTYQSITPNWKDITETVKSSMSTSCEEHAKCFGISADDYDTVCSGKGECVFKKGRYDTFCDCNDGMYGPECNVTLCYGFFSNDSEVCTNGNGKCLQSGKCQCYGGFYGLNCSLKDCFGYVSDDMICSNHGSCSINEFCTCDDGYVGEYCETTTCFGIFSNDTENVCGSSDRGECPELNRCVCHQDETNGYYYGKQCNVTECFNVLSNYTTSVCTNHGTCEDYNKCSCIDSEKYFGGNCEVWRCDDILRNQTSSACSGHGDCIDHDDCVCQQNYTWHEYCAVWECFGILNNDTDNNVCRNHGKCTEYQTCDCEPGYTHTANCDWTCFDVDWRNEDEVCSTNGDCLGHDYCNCTKNGKYIGEKCDKPTCFGISSEDKSVCGSHGRCFLPDTCSCDDNYGSMDKENGEVCNVWYCFQIHKDVETSVCSKKGTCVGHNLCDCKDNYEGDNCETWSCFSVKKEDEEKSCSGHGECKKPDFCKCQSGFKGESCEINKLYETVMAPVLGSSVGIIVLFCCLCSLSIVCSLCFCFCVFCCILNCLWINVVSQKTKLKKFSMLRDLDIVLEEQRMEDDTSIAHIKFRTKLFEVDYKEIKVESLLGEGGSQAHVYLSSWKGKKVAFKCFKTRLVCGSQDNFDEFEQEVSVFSSISHPNVVRFYGATIKPPRVGILMEYCSKGEILEFVQNYRKVTGNAYPIESKLRILKEIISAMEYLHSRAIVHRDLKCENVLLDNDECAKLMDFGLANISERLSKQQTRGVGTAVYMAPEVVRGDGFYNEKCDVYSYGILCWVFLTELEQPYSDMFGIELKVALDPTLRPDVGELEKCLDEEHYWLIEVIEDSWNHNGSMRPSFEELMSIFEKQKDVQAKISKEWSTRTLRSTSYSQSEKELDGMGESDLREMVKNLRHDIRVWSNKVQNLVNEKREMNREIVDLRSELSKYKPLEEESSSEEDDEEEDDDDDPFEDWERNNNNIKKQVSSSSSSSSEDGTEEGDDPFENWSIVRKSVQAKIKDKKEEEDADSDDDDDSSEEGSSDSDNEEEEEEEGEDDPFDDWEQENKVVQVPKKTVLYQKLKDDNETEEEETETEEEEETEETETEDDEDEDEEEEEEEEEERDPAKIDIRERMRKRLEKIEALKKRLEKM